MWNDLENKIISYADDKSPSERTNVAISFNRDLAKIQSSTWGMKLSPHKTQSINISRSRTSHQPLTVKQDSFIDLQ